MWAVGGWAKLPERCERSGWDVPDAAGPTWLAISVSPVSRVRRPSTGHRGRPFPAAATTGRETRLLSGLAARRMRGIARLCDAPPTAAWQRGAMDRGSSRRVRLLAIGSSAGLFSGLFGVGGGTVIVPLAILWLGYREREAAGTALAAVAIVAAVGAAAQGAYGAVHVRDAALVGLPAVLGVLAGTALQQRIPQRPLSLAFSVVLIAIAINMVVK